MVCKSWLCLAFDELLWKDLFHRHWNINRLVTLAPGKQSWVEEYKRLLYHVPTVEIEVVKKHTDEVLHVSFSNNGKMFTTTSKDGFVMVSICYLACTKVQGAIVVSVTWAFAPHLKVLRQSFYTPV